MRPRPFGGYLVRPDVAERVVAPPRGQVSQEELEAHIEAEPLSILHVVRSGSSIPPERLAEHRLACARQLRAFLHHGIFEPLEEPTYLVYRSTDDGHTVTGLLAEVPVAAYEEGQLKPHERLREEQVERIADHLDAVGASSLPVMAAYRSAPDLDALTSGATDAEPLVDITVAGGRQTLWSVPPERHPEVRTALSDKDDLYIADGHHRVEAARRVAERRRSRPGGRDPDAPHQHLLILMAAADDFDTVPYHRWLRDTGRADPELSERLRERGFDVTRAGPEPVRPDRNGEFGMLLHGTWFRLSAPADLPSSAPTDRVAASILHERILTPLFAVDHPESDPRLEFVSGDGGVQELVERCRRDGGIGFTLAPTDVGAVLDVADAGETMPPKSTWFVPKLCSGLLLRVIEGLGGPAVPRAAGDEGAAIGTSP
ncbi:MAG: DUF1015 family protein [Actinobacteria bacterium]|nr:DUF1015 family protein [Actinomycetota bacterium]